MGVGVNTTDPLAATVHGTNPQNLVEKITRLKVYASLYWKEHCFGLTAETLVDRAMGLQYFGGTYGGLNKPTKFLCLVLKMLQLQPEKDIIIEFIKNPDFKYARVLGAFYLRLVGRPADIYKYLELLYNDYRKIRHRTAQGWEVIRVDEFIDELLTKDYACDIALPRLPKRWHLEDAGMLNPRTSLAEEALEESEDEGEVMPASEADASVSITAEANAASGSCMEVEQVAEREVPSDMRRDDRANDTTQTHRRDESPRRRGRSGDRSGDRNRERGGDRRDDRRRSRSRSRSRERSRRRTSRSRSYERRRDYRRGDRSPRRSHHHTRSRSPRRDDDRRRDETERRRSRSSSEERKKRKKSSKSKKRAKDALFKKGSAEEVSAEGTSTGASKGESKGDGLSIEETNQLRLSLGLKPLKT